jgi:imidazolonepropionase-like amidohydrolase
MYRQGMMIGACVAAMAGMPAMSVRAQEGGKYLAPSGQVIAIKAGRLFDSRSGNMINNQVILVRGDRIADVGEAVQIPPGATVIDLSSATVMPGMIDTHVHVNTGGVNLAQRALLGLGNAQMDLKAGFTTVMDMDSRGTFYTVDLRDAINAGYVQGPRMQVVGR